MNALKDRQIVLDFLIENFGYSLQFANNWISSINPQFGLSSPEDLINVGRVDKVMLFLIARKEGY